MYLCIDIFKEYLLFTRYKIVVEEFLFFFNRFHPNIPPTRISRMYTYGYNVLGI